MLIETAIGFSLSMLKQLVTSIVTNVVIVATKELEKLSQEEEKEERNEPK